MAVALVAALFGRRIGGLIPAAAELIAGMGFWGPLAFGALYVVGDLVLIPGSVLTLAAGALFGLWWGTLIALVASTGGAVVAFFVARHLARPYVTRWLAGDLRLLALDAVVSRQGFRRWHRRMNRRRSPAEFA